jgi:hypothetical protein
MSIDDEHSDRDTVTAASSLAKSDTNEFEQADSHMLCLYRLMLPQDIENQLQSSKKPTRE